MKADSTCAGCCAISQGQPHNKKQAIKIACFDEHG